MIFCFGEHELDEERFELRRGGTAVLLQPKVLELLLYLVRQRDRVVSKREILDAIWPDSVVTDGSIARAVSLARRAIGDRGGRSASIATVARRGYRFEAPVRARPAPVVADDSKEERYVGRVGLLARFSETLATALSGRGRILFLAGEAGIGKTRTAEVLAERARRAGAAVATAWGGDADAPAYWTWTRALRGLARLLPDVVARLSPAQRSALSPLMPELGGVRATPRSTPGGEHSARVELFEAVQMLLGCCAESRPLALFLDDLHVAGAESLALLEFVGQTLDSLPIAIVATCREDEAARAPQTARALERLLRLRALERWPLAGLAGEEICDFVRAQCGAEADPALIRALERQTGGNPLLLGESLRSLEARGLLGVTREAKVWESLLPRGIEHLLHPKLRRLSAGAADVLRCAAAIGVELERDLLARCLPGASDLDARLRELEDAALLFGAASPALRLRFAHVLVRHALYEELAPAGACRRALHARIAAALPESSSADAVAERAHHACEAAPLVAPAGAAALARAAGDDAARLYDFERAAEWYGRALATLELAPGSDPVLVAELLLSLGDAQVRAVGLERGRASYRVAAERARSLGRGDLLARAALGLAQEPQGGNDGEPEWVEVLEEAERAVPTLERALHIRVQSRLGAELRHIDRARGVALVEAAIAEARQLGDPCVLARTLEDGLYVRWTPEDPAPAIALNREIVRAARSAGDLELALLAQRSCVASHLELGDIATVDREIRDCEAMVDVLRTPNARWQHTVLRAMRALVDGDLEAAERDVRLAIQVGERLDESYVSLQLPLQLAYLRLEQGRGAEIEPGAREQVRRFPEMSAWRAGLARLLVAAGRSAEAREELGRLSRSGFADIPRDRGWLMTLALASEVAFATGDVRASELLEPLLAPCANLYVVGGGGLVYYGPVQHHLGLLDLARSRWDAAVARLEQALAAGARVGAPLWEARTRIAYARALLGRALPGDRALAVTLATAASEPARAAGWVAVAADARAVESALWTQRRGSGPEPGRSVASES